MISFAMLPSVMRYHLIKSMSMTTYREIPNHPGYRIGDDGTVWSCKNGRWGLTSSWRQLKPGIKRRNGIAQGTNVRLGSGKQNQYSIHRLVLSNFVGQCPRGKEG